MVAYTDLPSDARIRREAETLARHGFHVRCLALKAEGHAAPRTFTLNDVEIRELPVLKYRGKSTLAYMLSYLRFLASATAACARLLFKGELDVVHVHNLPDFLVVSALLPRLAGCRVVLDVHDSVPETFATKFAKRPFVWSLLCLEERLSALLAHRVICVNHPQRDTLVARGIRRSKTFISMNVPDPRIFNHAADPSASPLPAAHNGHVNLVYHGTMAERLGVDLVIRAVARLEQRLPNIRLHLWGHGDDLASFQRLARELSVHDRVLFEPRGFPLQDLPGHLRAMDLGVIGNRRTVAGELMLPVKLLEYVALGIPVVVPRLKAIEHYFTDEMAAYYVPEDVDSLADCIYRLCTDRPARVRQARRAAMFLDEHGWSRQGDDFVNFYRDLVGVPIPGEIRAGEIRA
jgi:glycosyltransferase involved in cell wall biosynthesis